MRRALLAVIALAFTGAACSPTTNVRPTAYAASAPAPTSCQASKRYARSWNGEDVYLAEVTAPSCDRFYFLGLEGPITQRNLNLMQRAHRDYTRSQGMAIVGVMFNSPGGTVDAAVDTAKWILQEDLATYVAEGMICASACTIAFMAGESRWMEQGSAFGIHSAYTTDGRPAPEINELSGHLVSALGGHGRAYAAIAQGTSPGDMTWLTPSQAQAMNFVTHVI